jgi:hypothetical protein
VIVWEHHEGRAALLGSTVDVRRSFRQYFHVSPARRGTAALVTTYRRRSVRECAWRDQGTKT